MKERWAEDHRKGNGEKGSKSSFLFKKNTKNTKNTNNIKKKRKRLGGGGLPLETFANAKSKSSNYNPAIIKKQREAYKNAKQVSKYKKLLKQQSESGNDVFVTRDLPEDYSKGEDDIKMNEKNKKKKKSMHSLGELYEKKREEDEKAKMEREAINQAKKEAREQTEARRKAVREKMFKKTRSGQPVMKYRIESLLQSIQGSSN